MMKFITAAMVVGCAATVAPCETTEYGSFRHHSELPDVLFLIGQIGSEDSFELRRAMRDHEISVVVTASAGGNLYEGLQMASILHDRSMSTYVPPGVNCESSCANIFFGGLNRVALGELGVHQFYSVGNGSESSAPMNATASAAQFTTSDIIGIMNEFETPPFVYEKMFGTSDIYYFKETEKLKINRGASNDDFLSKLEEVDAFIESNADIVARPNAVSTKLSFEVSGAPPPPPATPSASPSTAIERYVDVDFFGADISPKGVRDVSLQDCANLCAANSACAAYSYVVATRWCWPKYQVTNISYAPGTHSGVKDYRLVDTSIFARPFVEASARDIPGFDIFPTGLKNMSLEQCRSACEATAACVAFSWVSKKNICYPKFAAGGLSNSLGTISGIKK